jgi:septation ring formation regulator EzrA
MKGEEGERIERLEVNVARIEGAVRAMERVQAAIAEQLDALYKEARAAREAIVDLSRVVTHQNAAGLHGGKVGGAGSLQ